MNGPVFERDFPEHSVYQENFLNLVRFTQDETIAPSKEPIVPLHLSVILILANLTRLILNAPQVS